MLSSTSVKRLMPEYAMFDMCPFSQARVGETVEVAGIGKGAYEWTHVGCIGRFCKLYVYKFNDKDELYAEGCNFQFQGMSEKEILQNAEMRRRVCKNNNQRPPPSPTIDKTIAESQCCPNGCGQLRLWDGVPTCWHCGWPKKT